MARPKKAPDEQRSELTQVRLTPAEKRKIVDTCTKAGISEGDFLRRRALNYTVPAKASLSDAALISEINRIGVNVNQLAAATHMDREFVAYWQEIGAELEAILEKVSARL